MAFKVSGLYAQPISSASKVQVSTEVSQTAVLDGEIFQTVVVMDIAEGWHINANRPTLEWLIGTTLNLDLPEIIQPRDIQYPPFKEYEFSFAQGQKLHVYEGVSPIFLSFDVIKDASVGDYEITGSLRVQACDDQVCLAPSNIPISFSIRVTDSPDEVTTSDFTVFDSYEPSSGNFVTFDQAGEQNDRRKRAFLGICCHLLYWFSAKSHTVRVSYDFSYGFHFWWTN